MFIQKQKTLYYYQQIDQKIMKKSDQKEASLRDL